MTTKTRQTRILVVEDEHVTQQFLKKLLTNAGYVVELCVDGESGIYTYASDPNFDAVILDMMMPGLGGKEFLAVAEAMYKNQVRDKRGRILVYSSMTDYKELKSYLNLDTVGFVITKPSPKDEILKSLGYMLSSNAEEQSFPSPTV